ncbi:MAG TPA: 3'-5' exonuclease, partial [Elusimicrobiota bacterium]|nr:3'-5' exonuclease [Elusimicrobiota bacterium]
KERLERMLGHGYPGMWAGTFHAFGAWFLRHEAGRLGYPRSFIIYDSEDQRSLVNKCIRDLKLKTSKGTDSTVAWLIAMAKDTLQDYTRITCKLDFDPGPVIALYEERKKAYGAFDFGDLLKVPGEMLQSMPEVKGRYQSLFRYLLVDEYQDTNMAQYVMLMGLVNSEQNICVVGDDDQSIYSWRGANVRNILEFERDYPGAAVVKLEQNYRSTETILAAAWKIIRRNKFRKEKRLWTDQAGGLPVRFQEFANELEEARAVARETARLLAAGEVVRRDVAVFYRTNAQSRVLEDAFRRENIPYSVVGGVRFYERAEVRDVLAFLRVLLNPADSVSLKRILNVPPRGIGKTTVQALEKYALAHGVSFYESIVQSARVPDLTSAARGNLQKFLDILRPLAVKMAVTGAAAMVQAVLEETGCWDHWQEQTDDDPEAAYRLDNLQELVNAAKEFEESSEDRSTALFLERVSLVSDIDGWNDADGSATFMTVHLAKGLEFPAVFMTGMEEGLFPIGESAFDEEELEEERRLCYVGMTRARRHLFLTAAASRKIYGKSHWNVPSRFVQEAELASVPAPAPGRSEEYGAVVGAFDPDELNRAALPTPGGLRPLQVGMRVRHPSFGEGRIAGRSGAGENLKVTVDFDSGMRKTIVARYASFEILKG